MEINYSISSGEAFDKAVDDTHTFIKTIEVTVDNTDMNEVTVQMLQQNPLTQK